MQTNLHDDTWLTSVKLIVASNMFLKICTKRTPEDIVNIIESFMTIVYFFLEFLFLLGPKKLLKIL